ncbi:amino acid ABC transporter permease [Georgenia yuyongxinii]|nr:amino acid ABC transporter permease [Georgenia yuyongxinii]
MPSTTTQQETLPHSRLLALPRRNRFNLVRWVILIAVIYVVAVVGNLLVFNESWNWPLVAAYLFSQRIMLAVFNTIWLTVLSLAVGLLLGLLACGARLSRFAVLRSTAFAYVWLVRATPPLVILLLIYFLGVLKPTLGLGIPFLPYLVEWPTNDLITPFTAAVVGLSFYLGGKTAEIFRSGFLAVGAGQREAVRALGLSPWTALTRVTGPQAVRVLIPPMANEVVTMFKNTSLVSVVGFAELLTTAQRLYAANFETIPMLTVACVWYLGLTSVLMVGQLRLERRFARGFDRRPNPNMNASKDQDLGPAVLLPVAVPVSETVNQKGDVR